MLIKTAHWLGLPVAMLALAACTPTVQLAAPSDPITINLNVKVEHEVLVKVDRQIDTLLEENSDLF
ncbi:YnbE family lipoprotein [Marinobacterium sp. YM272]|uniref:YnbE family lipoprotein n=1 Tax=Marinobacterium sp. YM272 TaxID=3421654 RepID=UPI003D7FD368